MKVKVYIEGKEQEVELKQVKKLGDGSFGQVFLYKDQENRQYAVKIGAYRDIEGSEFEYLRNVYVNQIGEQEDNRNKIIIMPLLGDDLDKFLEKEKLDFKQQVALARELAFAFNDFNCRGYIHNDLKEGNIAVSQNKENNIFNLSLIDFGSIDETETEKKIESFKTNTPYYAAKERENYQTGFKSDVFSLTPVFSKIFGTENPLQNRKQNSKYQYSVNIQGDFYIDPVKKIQPEFVSGYLFAFLNQMQKEAYDDRPNPNQVCHFFTNMDSLVEKMSMLAKEKNKTIEELTLEEILENEQCIVFLTKLKILSQGKWESSIEDKNDETLCNLTGKKYSFENFAFDDFVDNNQKKHNLIDFVKNDKDVFDDVEIKNKYIEGNRNRYLYNDKNDFGKKISTLNDKYEELCKIDIKQIKKFNLFFKENKQYIDSLKTDSPIMYKKFRDKQFDIFKSTYNTKFKNTIFKNKNSEMKKNLDSKEITSMYDVEKHSEKESNSRTSNILKSLGMK